MHHDAAVPAVPGRLARPATCRGLRPTWMAGGAAIIVSATLLTGCKTSSSFAKPSWWSLGSTPKKDVTDGLASAPPYADDTRKPSEKSKPYPTTSTPGGYVLTGTSGAVAATPMQSPHPQTPVVYGSTPPAIPAAGPSTSGVVSAPGSGSSQPVSQAIAPQVGPYGGPTGDAIPPPGQPLPPFAPSGLAGTGGTPSEAPLPGAASGSFSRVPTGSDPSVRMADASVAAGVPPGGPSDAAVVGGTALGSRYAESTGSRFSAGGPQAVPSESPQTPTAARGAFEPLMAPPSSAPAVAPPQQTPPASTPGLLQPAAPPVRRPDPGYRPGGTSSYKPSRTILADDPPSRPEAVRTASFEESAPPTIR